MKQRKWMALGLGAALLLTTAACSADDSGSTDESESPSLSTEDDTASQPLSLLSTFVDGEGQPLTGVIIRVDDGTEELDYTLDDQGVLTLSDVPRGGTLEVTVLSEGSGAADETLPDETGTDDTLTDQTPAETEGTQATDAGTEEVQATDAGTEEVQTTDDGTDDGQATETETGGTDELTELARVTLVLTDSQVTDAVQEEDGSVSLSVASDAESVSLRFTLDDSGALQCTLDVADETTEE